MSDDAFTRDDLAVALSQKSGCSVEAARKLVECMIASMQEALRHGRKVEFRGFGVLHVVVRNPKVGRNPRKPQDGTCKIPARRIVKFRVGKQLDKVLNKKGRVAQTWS